MAKLWNQLSYAVFSFHIWSSWCLKERPNLTRKQPPASCLQISAQCNYEQNDTAYCAPVSVNSQTLFLAWSPLFSAVLRGVGETWFHSTCTLICSTEVLETRWTRLVKTERKKVWRIWKRVWNAAGMTQHLHTLQHYREGCHGNVCNEYFPHFPSSVPSLYFPLLSPPPIGKNAWKNDAYKSVWLYSCSVWSEIKQVRGF